MQEFNFDSHSFKNNFFLNANKSFHINQALIKAAKSGDVENVKNALNEGAYIEIKDETEYLLDDTYLELCDEKKISIQRTPLHWASANGHSDVVTLLIKKKANIESEQWDKARPLHCAAWNGNLRVVKILIEEKANPHSKSSRGFTPLHSAAYMGHLDVVRFLIMNGANTLSEDVYFRKPIDLAIKRKNSDIMIFLKEKEYAKPFFEKNSLTNLTDSNRNLKTKIKESSILSGKIDNNSYMLSDKINTKQSGVKECVPKDTLLQYNETANSRKTIDDKIFLYLKGLKIFTIDCSNHHLLSYEKEILLILENKIDEFIKKKFDKPHSLITAFLEFIISHFSRIQSSLDLKYRQELNAPVLISKIKKRIDDGQNILEQLNPKPVQTISAEKLEGEQRLFRTQQELEKKSEFKLFLNDIKLYAAFKGLKPKKVFISYAWPIGNLHYENWTQSFIRTFASHFNEAGLEIYLDILQSGYGMPLNQFMDQKIIKADHILFISTRTMKYKYDTDGYSGACYEYFQAMNRWREERKERFIIPVCLNSEDHSSGFVKTFSACSPYLDGYENSLKGLLIVIYGFSPNFEEDFMQWRAQKHGISESISINAISPLLPSSIITDSNSETIKLSTTLTSATQAPLLKKPYDVEKDFRLNEKNVKTSQSEKKIQPNTFTATAVNNIKAGNGSYVNVSGSMAAHTIIDINPEDMRNLPPEIFTLMKGAVDQGEKFKTAKITVGKSLSADSNTKINSEGTKAGIHIFNLGERVVSPAFGLSKPAPLADKKLLKEAKDILDKKYPETDALEDESILNYRNNILQQFAKLEGRPLSQTEKQGLELFISDLKDEEPLLKNSDFVSELHHG